MSAIETRESLVEVLLVARRIADHAKDEGVLHREQGLRPICEHLGAVLADSVLQAGLNYVRVVRPRVAAILQFYPERDTVSSLVSLVRDEGTANFLNWQHHEKLQRFEALVAFLERWGVEDVHDLRSRLVSDEFCEAIKTLNGVGPKTVDYMACLVGIDSIAVDRHVRAFAKAIGVVEDDYYFLRQSFCCAADLLSLPRREFDSWLWSRAAANSHVQLSLSL